MSITGAVYGMTGKYVVINAGKQAVIYVKGMLDRVPEVGERVEIVFKKGQATVKGVSVENGRNEGRGQ